MQTLKYTLGIIGGLILVYLLVFYSGKSATSTTGSSGAIGLTGAISSGGSGLIKTLQGR